MSFEAISRFLSDLLLTSPEGLSATQTLIALLVSYLGGVLASLTPCVYPMIPITLSVIGGMDTDARKVSWRDLSARSLSYVGGMALIYSFLGVLAGLSGRVFGTLTNRSGWYLTVGLIMTLASLMMLEVINFDPNVIWQNFKQQWFPQVSDRRPLPSSTSAESERTRVGAFLLGASSGLIAAPCTTPVLTTILAYIAKNQSVGLGFILMLAFSLGLGSLLLLIASFAGALRMLPRSGQWMKTLKIMSGLILLAFADYLIYRAGSAGGFLGQ